MHTPLTYWSAAAVLVLATSACSTASCACAVPGTEGSTLPAALFGGMRAESGGSSVVA